MSYYDDEEDFCVGCDCSHYDECCDIAYETALQEALKPYGVDTLEELIKSVKDKMIDKLIKLAKSNSIYGYSIALADLESITEQLKEQKNE